MVEENISWDAFISYNSADKEFARQLYKALNAYRPPKDLHLPPAEPGTAHQKLRAFRWEDDMVGTEYEGAIQSCLTRSRKMVLVCSPDARKAHWVNLEVRDFARIHGEDNIIPVLVRGKPNNVAGLEAENAFPPALCDLKKMPLSINYAGIESSRNKIDRGAKESDWFHLIAQILDKERAEVEQRELKLRAARRRIWASIWFLIAIISLGGALYTLYLKDLAITAQENAEREERGARTQLALTQWGNGVYFRDNNEPVRAAHWFAKAVASPDTNMANNARLAATQAIRGGALNDIFVHNSSQVRSPTCLDGSNVDCKYGSVDDIILNAAETRFLSWGDDGVLAYVDMNKGAEIITVQCGDDSVLCHEQQVNGAVMNGDSRILSWDSWDAVKSWNLPGCESRPKNGCGTNITLTLTTSEPLRGATATLGEQGNLFLNWSKNEAWLWDVDGEKLLSILQPEYHRNSSACDEVSIDDADFINNDTQIMLWGTCTSGKKMHKAFSILGKAVGVGGNWSEPQQLGRQVQVQRVDQEATIEPENLAQQWKQLKTLAEKQKLQDLGAVTGFWAASDPTIRGASINASGTKLLSWSESDGNTVRRWDLGIDKETTPAFYHGKNVRGAKFYQQDSRVLSWGDEGLIRSWIISPQPQKIVEENSDIISQDTDDCLQLNRSRLEQRVSSSQQTRFVGCVSYPEDDLLLSWERGKDVNGDGFNSVTLRRISSPTDLTKPLLHVYAVVGAVLDEDRKRILSWSEHGSVHLWDRSNSELLVEMADANQSRVNGARFNADETRILSWGKDASVRLWDASLGSLIIPPLVNPANLPIDAAAFTDDEAYLLTTDSEGNHWCWDLSYDRKADDQAVSLLIQASTGTRLTAAGKLEVLPVEEWREIREWADSVDSASCNQ